jgi:D-amino-acid dehydrogenase
MSAAAGPKRTVVVGGGIIGIACAHYLAATGRAVTVIDRGPIGGGCSQANCGYICPSHVLPLTEPGAIRTALRSLFRPGSPFRVKPRLSPALWTWLWQFARRCNQRQMLEAGRALQAILEASMAEYRRLMAEETLDCEWRENGLLYVLQTEHGMREFAANDRLLSDEFGVQARRIEGRDLPSFDPALADGLAGAFHYEGDASVRPDRLNAAWTDRLKTRGVEFVQRCELRGVEKSAGRVRGLGTSTGPIAVDEVVVALGAWSPQFEKQLGCRIPIEPGKGYSVTTAETAANPKYPMLFPEHRVGVSPFEGGCRLGSIMEFAGYDTSIPPSRIEQLHAAARHYLRTPIAAGGTAWYGWRPMTWDSLPIIGRVPNLTNAWLATGHNMLGMSLATATGRLVAELMDGAPPHIDPAPYSPSRF